MTKKYVISTQFISWVGISRHGICLKLTIKASEKNRKNKKTSQKTHLRNALTF